jgi:hypothetical protein
MQDNMCENRPVYLSASVPHRHGAAPAVSWHRYIARLVVNRARTGFLPALSSRLRKTIAESACIIDQYQRYRFQSASNSYIAAV